MTDLDLTQWCQQRAAKYREYEHINMAAAEDRDTAIVEWVVRVLGNPELPESREVLRLLAERHDGASVLTEEPAEDVVVVDVDGDPWRRVGALWVCQVALAAPVPWAELTGTYGPVRRSAS